MTWTTWWLFATTETVLSMTPGPAVLYVLSSALQSSPRGGVASIFGILSANAVYFVLSGTSVRLDHLLQCLFRGEVDWCRIFDFYGDPGLV
jgi:threonine/homoserine/homoserine lactone efflux protein